MTLTYIFTKSLRERWTGTAIGMAITGAFLVMAMAAYQSIDVSVYTDLPEGIRSVMGIPDNAEPATLAYNIVLGMICAMTLSGLTLGMGASSVAGEERDGTIGLLLGNPLSRRSLLVAKAGALAVLATAGAGITLGASYLAPAILAVDIGMANLVAVTVHLLFNALLWGAMALAWGAVTGNRSLAAAATAGFMVGCYFLVGLLPLVSSLAAVAKVLPWYWFDGHDPLNNGISVGYLSLQVALIVALVGVAWWGVESRDLTKSAGTRTVVADIADRLRGNERAAELIDRLSGGARVSSIWIKTTAEGQALVLIVTVVMFAFMGVMMGPIYTALESTLADLSGDLPDELLAIVGGGDMSTPEGWYQVETFGLMAPIATALVAAVGGVKALAGEEHDRTMGLLLANPIARRQVVLQKLLALVIHTSIVGVAIWAGVVGGSVLGGLGMSVTNIAAASFQVTLLGIMFGAFALAVSAATGNVRLATFATVGVVGASYACNSIFAVADDLDRWKQLSPFDWYFGDDPLRNGIEWSSVVLFIGFTAALTAAAVVLFDRRDLRRG